MNWGQLAKKIEKMTDAERKPPVTFVEPYDEPKAHRELWVVRATEDILTVDDDHSVVKVRVSFTDTDDGRVYGTEDYLVETQGNGTFYEDEAVKEALKRSEDSKYDDPRVDHTRTATVVERMPGKSVAVREGEFMLQ